MSAGRAHALEPPAAELIEEAVHLLRRAPVGWFALYLVGVGPFIIALLFFWAWVTWARPPTEEIAWAALGLVPLFLWMKAIQSECCARLLALCLDAPPVAWQWGRLARLLIAQARIQTWASVLLGPALLAVFPFAWVFAYGQSATVIGEGKNLHHETAAQAKLWPFQNFLGLTLIGALGACLTLNLAACFYLVPWFGNRVLGVENIFNLGGWSLLNTTSVASVIALGWAASDPLVKAFYVLRVFHGRSLRSGEDLRTELKRIRRAPAFAAVCLALLLAGTAVPLSAGTAPAAAAAQPGAVRPEELDRAVDSVLARAEYGWRMHPLPEPEDAGAKDGAFVRFVRAGLRLLGGVLRSIFEAVRAIAEWIRRHFGRPDAATGEAAGSTAVTLVRALLYVFIAVAVIALGWLAWLVAERSMAARRLPAVVAAVALKPDLASEELQAAHLPADGWLALAREQMARRDWRLAQRALYMALLASLASQGLLSLARFKTNLDYERELRRRALSRGDIPARFAERRREFEDAWYGRAVPAEERVRGWLAEFEPPAAR
jgi:hypothetical protein